MSKKDNIVDKGGVDLHCHTKTSDGKYSIYSLLDMAVEQGLSAIAITDHNYFHYNISAISTMYKDKGLKVIKGAEITASYRINGKSEEIHIVALNINPWKLKPLFDKVRKKRKECVSAILFRLKINGIADITYDELINHFDSNYLGKVHIAQLLCDKGIVSSVYEGLDVYVGNLGKRKCWVPSNQYIYIPPLKDVVKAIIYAGGIPVLAHPFYYKSLTDDEREQLICDFKTLAGDSAGMEVYYKDYTEDQTAILENLATKYQLFPSGGSDFHGWSDTESLMQINPEILKNLIGEMI